MVAYPKPGWPETIAIEASHSKTDIFGTDSAYLRTIQYFLRRLPVGTALAINQLAVILPGKRQCCALQGALRPRCHTPTIAPRFSNGSGTHVRQPYSSTHRLPSLDISGSPSLVVIERQWLYKYPVKYHVRLPSNLVLVFRVRFQITTFDEMKANSAIDFNRRRIYYRLVILRIFSGLYIGEIFASELIYRCKRAI